MIFWAEKVQQSHPAVSVLTSASEVRAECSPDGTIGELKELIGAQIGIDRKNIQLKKW
ncbi:hypothetical protein EDD16DRAFT_1620954 [Pisolithus croceorrhizus]|nr:hypothetical protein EDD16DRAFT_1620954 [Pisolithus croceorrhizus]